MVDREPLGQRVLKIRPGTQVVSDRDQVGRVERIVLQPESGEVGGIVELSGHTSTRLTRKKIEDVARSVRGVIDVEDYLDTVEDLKAAAREANRAASTPSSRPVVSPS